MVVVTEYPLGDIIRNKDVNGRIIKWAMELCSFSLEFASRTTVKSQALVDCYQKMGVTPGCFLEWPEQVEPLGHKGPC